MTKIGTGTFRVWSVFDGKWENGDGSSIINIYGLRENWTWKSMIRANFLIC